MGGITTREAGNGRPRMTDLMSIYRSNTQAVEVSAQATYESIYHWGT